MITMPCYDVFLAHENNDKMAIDELLRRYIYVGLQPKSGIWNLIASEPWQVVVDVARQMYVTCTAFVGRKLFVRGFNRILVCIFLALSLLFAGCNSETRSQTVNPATTLDPRLATPQLAFVEEPLQGRLIDMPEVWVATSRQSKRALVNYLYTPQGSEAADQLLEQLEWVNPSLSDPILPGTLVVIPPVYRVSQSETLSEIGQTMGYSEELMSAANPDLAEKGVLNPGTVVALPRLYIVTQDTLLSATAEVLQTSDDALMSANPALAEQQEVSAGTVLVVPPQQEEQP